MNRPASHERSAPRSLEPDVEQIKAMGYSAIDILAEHYASLSGRPIYPETTSSAIREQLTTDLPEEGVDFDSLLRVFADVIVPNSRQNAHPRMFGYVTSPGTPATAIADLLASALNTNVTSWRSAPVATEVERMTIDWIRQIAGFPPGSGGLFVSGGSMANLCGIAAARDAAARVPVTQAGCQALDRPMRLYISEQGHHSVSKAAGLLGIGRENVREIAVDSRLKMDVGALESAIQADITAEYQPFCVVGSAGTVHTGAVDDIDGIADVAARFGLWFHVDGAYGGFATLAPSLRPMFRGIERADSLALDPHKWLYAPVDCGCILYRDPERAKAVFGHDAEYTRILDQQDEEAFAFWDYGPELSRRFRALKVWMMLKHAGTRALGGEIEGNCRCARYFAELVEDSDDFEMLAPVELSIFCFRYLPPEMKARLAAAQVGEHAGIEEEANQLNERLLVALQRGGSSYLSNTRIGGGFALRGCVMNFRTTEADMDRLLQDLRNATADLMCKSDTRR